jgi:hypothetical protein
VTTLYVAVSNGFAWGVGGGGTQTGPDRAIEDATRELVTEAERWGLTQEQGRVLATLCPFDVLQVTHEQAKRVALGERAWPLGAE